MQSVVNKLIQSWKSGQFAPVYVFAGEEPYFVNAATEALLELALPEADRVFNQSLLYGRDADARRTASAVVDVEFAKAKAQGNVSPQLLGASLLSSLHRTLRP